MDWLTSSTIKQKARDLGFDLCGIAPAESFPELAFLREWVERGYADACSALAERSPDRPSADDEMVQEHVAWAMKVSQE